jgi:hypothetical protein
MAESRAVLEKVSFLELFKKPSLCAEVMVTAVEKLGVDAAIDAAWNDRSCLHLIHAKLIEDQKRQTRSPQQAGAAQLGAGRGALPAGTGDAAVAART